MYNNGLILNTTNSRTENMEIIGINDFGKYIKDKSFVIAYLDNEVLFGTYNNGVFEFHKNKYIELEYLKRLRIFNKNEELHIWYSNGKLIGRYRTDTEGEETDFIEANQVIFGTKAQYENAYTILTEERGVQVVLPGEWEADSNKKRVAIKTRHYIEYLNGYQASYCDSRFVDFVQLPIKGGN